MKKTNQIFSFKRFGLLIRRETILGQSSMLTTMSVIFGILLIIFMFTQYNSHSFGSEEFLIFFIAFLLIYGSLYVGVAFPYFRNNIRAGEYLLIPNSRMEKYTFEILSRLIFFLLVYPIIYWLAAKISCLVINQIHPRDLYITFSIKEIFEYMRNVNISIYIQMLGVSGTILLFSSAFLGASYFKRNPLIKTAVAIIFLGFLFFFYGYLLDQIFRYSDGPPPSFLRNMTEEEILIYISVFFLSSAILLLIVAFFKLKEKEA